ncbi:hypothetical protein IFM89_001189 [Coptis chinensis]|uniref:EF-hand domain-containing protein n=1 Tax=Coptis chinensis TaxID=261450 RepID=A0A835IIJ6_9MAGN|nr:hypothetical protein IFM89_001189 [Coptis chinensis]
MLINISAGYSRLHGAKEIDIEKAAQVNKGSWQLQVKVPVIVVGCKLDEVEDTTGRQEKLLLLMQEYPEIETCTLECSAWNLFQVSKVFYYANVAVLFPTSPLFDKKKHKLKPRCERALKRIFNLCDHDKDNTFSDIEFNDLQVCFHRLIPRLSTLKPLHDKLLF